MLAVKGVRYWRQRRALSQEELGKLAGIPQPTIARIEGRGTARPSTVRKLAAALQVGVEELMAGEQPPGQQAAAA